MRKAALRSVLTAKLKDDRLTVVDKIELDAPKTKLFAETMKAIGLETEKILFVTLKRMRLCFGRQGTSTGYWCFPQRGSTFMTCFVSTASWSSRLRSQDYMRGWADAGRVPR